MLSLATMFNYSNLLYEQIYHHDSTSSVNCNKYCCNFPGTSSLRYKMNGCFDSHFHNFRIHLNWHWCFIFLEMLLIDQWCITTYLFNLCIVWILDELKNGQCRLPNGFLDVNQFYQLASKKWNTNPLHM